MNEAEQVSGYILGHTARYTPVMGALEATRWHIDALLTCFAQVEAAIDAAIAHHAGQTPAAGAGTPRPSPWVQNRHGDRYPEEVMPYEEALPQRVRTGTGMPIVGYVQLDGQDFGSITAIRTDPWATAVARRVLALKLRRGKTLFNHVEMKTVAMMIETGAKHGQVIINHAPCGSERNKPPGCEQALPEFIPAGRSLTVLGTDAQGQPFKRTYHGKAEK
ncbi:SCP1.201-like deaminase [Actinokineospora globicatena]|nr:SCP1.201-like deaminase [Actinokineospora globicatena]